MIFNILTVLALYSTSLITQALPVEQQIDGESLSHTDSQSPLFIGFFTTDDGVDFELWDFRTPPDKLTALSGHLVNSTRTSAMRTL